MMSVKNEKVDSSLSYHEEQFLVISQSHYGIHQRAVMLCETMNSLDSDFKEKIEQLRKVSLGDLWFYFSQSSFPTFFQLIHDYYQQIAEETTKKSEYLNIIKNLFEFNQLLGETQLGESLSLTFFCQNLSIVQKILANNPSLIIHISPLLKKEIRSFKKEHDYMDRLKVILKKALLENQHCWEQAMHWEEWCKRHQCVFNESIIADIKKRREKLLEENSKQLEKANKTIDLLQIKGLDESFEYFLQSVSHIPLFNVRIFFLLYMIELPFLENFIPDILIQLKSLLSHDLSHFMDKSFSQILELLFHYFDIFQKKYPEQILDCVYELGVNVLRTGKKIKINCFISNFIKMSFIEPGFKGIDRNWESQINPGHVKNIKTWLKLVQFSPQINHQLLLALIVHLSIRGTFIKDEHLLQREISNLLNHLTADDYYLIPQLARLLPVFFTEIGADQKIREITTNLDAIYQRKNILVHFLRKQIHCESSFIQVELTEKILLFWYSGNIQYLSRHIPESIIELIDKKSEFYVGIHQAIMQLCQISQLKPLDLIKKQLSVVIQYIDEMKGINHYDKECLLKIFELNHLLREKYYFNSTNIINLLQESFLVNSKKVTILNQFLQDRKYKSAISEILGIIGYLKNIVLDNRASEVQENLYFKRHIAVGIPSLYGNYKDKKIEALRMIFRLENLVEQIFDAIISEKNLDYMTFYGIKGAAELLDLFKEGIGFHGIVNKKLISNLGILHYSLKTSTFSIQQYINIFQFIVTNIKEIIDKYYITPFIPILDLVMPIYFEDRHGINTDNESRVFKQHEIFYREIIASAFLIQKMDQYIAKILSTLKLMVKKLPINIINTVLNYRPDLIISDLFQPDPRVDNQSFLGSKAYFLKVLANYHFPVPHGFVLTTEWFRNRKAIKQFPEMYEEILLLINHKLKKLEKHTDKKYGDPSNPLLLSVRSGTVISMPGAMDTFLNVGMNKTLAEQISKKKGYGWAAWDCYRRLLQNWGMAYGITRDEFDSIIGYFKKYYGINEKRFFTKWQMKEIAQTYGNLLKEKEIIFENDLFKQLIQAISLVFQSWNNKRAKIYRKKLQIAEEWGTSVIIQEMILGNLSHESGTGVVFTKVPNEKDRTIQLYGDFDVRSQGEDIVAGLVHTMPISNFQGEREKNSSGITLERNFPEIYQQLLVLVKKLIVDQNYEHQEIEFTFSSKNKKNLYILQTRDYTLDQHEIIDVFKEAGISKYLVGSGIGLGKTVINGLVAFDKYDLERLMVEYPESKRILIRPDTVPDDIEMIFECEGLLTSRGGMTSHAAVTAAQLGKTCVVNCRQLQVFEGEKKCKIGEIEFKVGDKIALDGHSGNIYQGHFHIRKEQSFHI